MRTALLGFLSLALVALCGAKVEAGVIEVSNYDKRGIVSYSGMTAFFGNVDWGASEGADAYDHDAFIEETPLPDMIIYSMEPGYRADADAKPVNTFGWLFDLATTQSITAADNYLKFLVTDSQNLPGLVAYDLANPSVKYTIPTDGSSYEINLGTLTVPAGEYAHWRMDIVPEPSAVTLLEIAAAVMAFGWWRRKTRLGRNPPVLGHRNVCHGV